jgi:hypothetical protein
MESTALNPLGRRNASTLQSLCSKSVVNTEANTQSLGILNLHLFVYVGPPLWSSGQSSWLEIQRSRVRFPALPDFLRNSGSGTGSTQPREDN